MTGKSVILSIAICIIGMGESMAQTVSAQDSKDVPMLVFDRNVIDAGTMTEDDAPQNFTFTGRNVSGKVLEISRIQTTCGCTKSGVSKNILQPGDSCRIEMTFTPHGYPGTIDTQAFVYLKEKGDRPVARIGLRGMVEPSADQWYRFKHRMGTLRLKQSKVTFSELKPGKNAEARILCGNSGMKPLRITSLVLPQYASVRTEPEVIKPGEEADLVITLTPDKIPATASSDFSFPIILEGIDARPSDRTITVTVNRK